MNAFSPSFFTTGILIYMVPMTYKEVECITALKIITILCYTADGFNYLKAWAPLPATTQHTMSNLISSIRCFSLSIGIMALVNWDNGIGQIGHWVDHF